MHEDGKKHILCVLASAVSSLCMITVDRALGHEVVKEFRDVYALHKPPWLLNRVVTHRPGRFGGCRHARRPLPGVQVPAQVRRAVPAAGGQRLSARCGGRGGLVAQVLPHLGSTSRASHLMHTQWWYLLMLDEEERLLVYITSSQPRVLNWFGHRKAEHSAERKGKEEAIQQKLMFLLSSFQSLVVLVSFRFLLSSFMLLGAASRGGARAEGDDS
jgi:hypothetical protein